MTPHPLDDPEYAMAATFTPQAVDLILNDRMSHGDLASRLAQARELARQGVDTSGSVAAILEAYNREFRT